MVDKEKQKIGKKELTIIRRNARAAGNRFELKVRSDLEEKGWIVAKWTNNVELGYENSKQVSGISYNGKFIYGVLVKVKNKFRGMGIPMMLGAGFPDFIAFTGKWHLIPDLGLLDNHLPEGIKVIIGVESKMNGYLDKQEKEKCAWLLKNNIFSKILIASKGTKRGQIVYMEFK